MEPGEELAVRRNLPKPHRTPSSISSHTNRMPIFSRIRVEALCSGSGVRGYPSHVLEHDGAIQNKSRHRRSDAAPFEAGEGEVGHLHRAFHRRALEAANADQLLRLAFDREVSEPVRRGLQRRRSS